MGSAIALFSQQTKSAIAPLENQHFDGALRFANGILRDLRSHYITNITTERNITVMTMLIANKRGFEFDYPGSMGLLLVKADIDATSEALASAVRGPTFKELNSDFASVIKDAYQNSDQVRTDWLLCWQYTGHLWSMIHYRSGKKHVPQKISEILDTDCIIFSYEDTSGWEGYELFRSGITVEAYDFGVDYRDEIAEMYEEMGEEPPSQEPEIPWDISTEDDTCQYLFRSTLRSVTEDEVKKSKDFLNRFFVEKDAWLPACEHMPWKTSLRRLSKSDFIRVDWVKN